MFGVKDVKQTYETLLESNVNFKVTPTTMVASEWLSLMILVVI